GTAIRGLFGFQHGGSFTVGGSGAPDSQLVAFRASPGEQVTVAPPGQAGINIQVINNAPNAQARVEQGPGGQRDIRIIVDEMVADAMSRPGSQTARTMRSVYGAQRTTIRR
ncbi:MAG: hypothetical protein ACREM3_30040, partial [Candidatus Rokuibacteriota bacterium]